MKVVIPVAGVGSRLKPHTNTIPKPLMQVAGKAMLDYVIEDALSINPEELIFIVGYKRESIKKHVLEKYPNVKKRFIVQKKRDGDGSAVRLGLEDIKEDSELLIIFGDTLIDFSLKNALKNRKNVDGIVFGMEVEDPRHYGVINLDKNNNIVSIEEKPEKPKSNIAIIGTYYFKSLQEVKLLLNFFYKKQETINGEYKIAQVLQELVKNKNKILKSSLVKKWFDCGRPEILLRSNQYFLKKNSKNSNILKKDYVIVPPCFIAKSAVIKNSIIGPYVSIADNVIIENSIIENSIINQSSSIKSVLLHDSLVGKEVVVEGKSTKINIGEKSQLILQ
jgi:glucose-1-phosphate thymidylyltransferase